MSETQKIHTIENTLSPPVSLKALPNPSFTIQERMAHYQVPAVSMALIDNGKIAWTKTWTRADQTSVTPETLFQAASMSKPIAAFAAMRMVDRGELALDEPINSYLSSWQIPDNALTRDVPVTLRQLLSHSAGTTVHGFAGYSDSAVQPSAVDVLQGGENTNSDPVRVDILPGSRFRYSGGGSTLFQQAMADVSQKNFTPLMDELVLQAVGMDNSTFEQPLPASLHHKAATGHLTDGAALPGKFHSYPEQAAAGLWCTAEDLAKFSITVMQCQQHAAHALLSPALSDAYLAEQISGAMGAWGLGFGLYQEEDKTIGFHHGGANAGFRGKTVGFLNGSGAVVMTNGESGNGLISEILTATAEAYNWPALKQKEKQWSALDENAQAQYIGEYEYSEAAGELKHSIKTAGDGLLINGAFFADTVLYFEKTEAGKDYFIAANGANLHFSRRGLPGEEEGGLMLNIAGYTLQRCGGST